MSGSYSLPWDVQLAGTYQFSRGIRTGVASRIVGLMSEGEDYGKHNLNQVDLRLGKRFNLPGSARLRVDFDLYNVLNSSWPYTVSNTYSTAATSNWQRPTNVLQHRFFKLGANFSF